jgi:8-oxo-dGTP pyrophosphatase MutT (NUDIX family)
MSFDIAIIKSNVKEVSSIAVIHDGKILMGKRNDNQRWTLPGGGLDEGEKPVDGAVRELFEEAGIKIKAKELKHLDTKKIKTYTGKNMTIHAFKYEWDGEKPTSKNDPDKEVKKWEWIDYSNEELPEEVASNLHSPKNVVLQAMGLVKGGPGSGVRGHHTEHPWRNTDVAGESSRPSRQPDHERDWDLSGLITDKRDKDRSLFYVSPKRKLKNRIEDEKIKQKEEESWNKLMQEARKKKSFQLFIDLMKAAGHKYLRKYRKGDKWVYIYYEPNQRPRHLEDEALQIIQRMAELGHEGAKKMMENIEDHTAQIEMSKDRAKNAPDAPGRQVHLEHLKNEYGIDKEAQALERDLLGTTERDTVEMPMSSDVMESLEKHLNKMVDEKIFGYLNSHTSNPHFQNLTRDGITKESLKEGVLNANNIKEALAKFHENLKKLDQAHEGLTSQNSFASQGYASGAYNGLVQGLESDGHLPRGYAAIHTRQRNQEGDFQAPKASELEEMQRRQEEERRRQEEERRRQEAERRRREEEELSRALAELDGSMAYHMVTLMPEGMSLEDKKRKALQLDREIRNIFGRRLAKEDFPYNFEGMRTEISSLSVSDNQIYMDLQVYNRDGEAMMNGWERVFDKLNGRPHIKNKFLVVNPNMRDGTRISDQINANQRKLMKSIPGGGTVTVGANIDVGGYTWANNGFSFEGGGSSMFSGFFSFLEAQGVNLTPEEKRLFKDPVHIAAFTNGKKYMTTLQRAIPLSQAQKDSRSLSGVSGEHPLTDSEIESGKTNRMLCHLGKKYLLGKSWSGVWDSEKDTQAARYAEQYVQLRENALRLLDEDYQGVLGAVQRGERSQAQPARGEWVTTQSEAQPASSSGPNLSERMIRFWGTNSRRSGRTSVRMTAQRIDRVARFDQANFEHFMRYAPITRDARIALRDARRRQNGG